MKTEFRDRSFSGPSELASICKMSQTSQFVACRSSSSVCSLKSARIPACSELPARIFFGEDRPADTHALVTRHNASAARCFRPRRLFLLFLARCVSVEVNLLGAFESFVFVQRYHIGGMLILISNNFKRPSVLARSQI